MIKTSRLFLCFMIVFWGCETTKGDLDSLLDNGETQELIKYIQTYENVNSELYDYALELILANEIPEGKKAIEDIFEFKFHSKAEIIAIYSKHNLVFEDYRMFADYLLTSPIPSSERLDNEVKIISLYDDSRPLDFLIEKYENYLVREDLRHEYLENISTRLNAMIENNVGNDRSLSQKMRNLKSKTHEKIQLLDLKIEKDSLEKNGISSHMEISFLVKSKLYDDTINEAYEVQIYSPFYEDSAILITSETEFLSVGHTYLTVEKQERTYPINLPNGFTRQINMYKEIESEELNEQIEIISRIKEIDREMDRINSNIARLNSK